MKAIVLANLVVCIFYTAWKCVEISQEAESEGVEIKPSEWIVLGAAAFFLSFAWPWELLEAALDKNRE